MLRRILVVLALVLIPFAALAALDPSDPLSIVGTIISAFGSKSYVALAGAVIIGVVWALRSFGGKYIPFFRTDRGGATLVLACAVLSAASSVLLGSGFSWSALVDGVLSAFVAAGGFSVVKKLAAPSDAPPAAK